MVAAFGGWDLSLTAFGTEGSTSALADCRANNLRPKRKQLSVVFATVDGTKQGVCRAEQAQARADDYATAAEGREVERTLRAVCDYIFKWAHHTHRSPTMLCIQFGCHPKKPRCHRLLGFFVPIFTVQIW